MEGKKKRAERRDARELAKLFYMAGRSHVTLSVYDLMIPGEPGMTDERIDALAGLINANADSWMSYRYYEVVEADGRAVSCIGSFTVEQSGDEMVGAALMELGWNPEDLMELGKRFAVWEATDPGRAAGFLVLENAATFEEYTGRGFMSSLLESAIKRARSEGFPGLQLTAMLGNDPAIRVYEKVGFRMDETKESAEFEAAFGSPGAGRMILDF